MPSANYDIYFFFSEIRVNSYTDLVLFPEVQFNKPLIYEMDSNIAWSVMLPKFRNIRTF